MDFFMMLFNYYLLIQGQSTFVYTAFFSEHSMKLSSAFYTSSVDHITNVIKSTDEMDGYPVI